MTQPRSKARVGVRPRSWDDPPMTGQNMQCVICASGTPSDVIAEGRRSWVTAPARAPLPGYVCVVSKTHVVEPFDLSPEHQAGFWLEVCAVARAVRDAVASPKINYEIHGNTIPHLHLHVFPRYPGDPFTAGPINGSSRAFQRSPAALRRLAAEVGNALASGPAR
jgi:diadenosine tetraphosphate (Ap4A) HIT family hydrolase